MPARWCRRRARLTLVLAGAPGTPHRLIERLSKDLSGRFGRGFSHRNLEQMWQFYEWTLLSKNKAAMLRMGAESQAEDSVSPEEEIKDPLVLEFLHLAAQLEQTPKALAARGVVGLVPDVTKPTRSRVTKKPKTVRKRRRRSVALVVRRCQR